MISVIVPLHNLGSKGDYCLKKCLDSLLAQTYTDFEVLLMENGSTDDTVEVAKEYCNKDKRFKLHILDTVGVSNARNKGIENSLGEYLCFIDGDDYISENLLMELINNINKSSNIDMVIVPCVLKYVKTGKQKNFDTDWTPRILNEINKQEVFTDPYIWGKLYKKALIMKYNIKFDVNLFGVDDFLFVLEYKLISREIAISDKETYFYIQGRSGQATIYMMDKMSKSAVILNKEIPKLFSRYGKAEQYKGFIDYTLITFFIGKDFTVTALTKMPLSDITEAINIFKDRLVNIKPDAIYCPNWQIKWFERFKFFVKIGLGAYFIKFMRLYRNLILQPLKIKYKAKKVGS